MTEPVKSVDLSQRKERLFWFAAFLVSLLFHVVMILVLSKQAFHKKVDDQIPEGFVKFDLPEKVKPAEQEVERILETPLEKTDAPDHADYLGQQDHIAKKKMKVKETVPRPKAADPGQTLKQQSKGKTPRSIAERSEKKALETGNRVSEDKLLSNRKSYEHLLAYSMDQMADQELKTGYLDYIDDLAEDGDAIDLNTQEYRYIGYFTNLRKAIELVWSYPSEAVRRGLDGRVRIKFVIQENGKVSKVSVLESSGHHILDEAIVNAIQLAAPFSPLPTGFNKPQLVVKGNFSYILSASAASY